MSKKDLKYYYKILEIKTRIKELKQLLSEGEIDILEYRVQLREILKELNEIQENQEQDEFSTAIQGVILNISKLA
ncbi:hypothetical protein EZY14_016450 [Kordia sp. TARA_039_SRF]|nr:hypothetical protein EZY14_016450 [Kordia sp. TARA_039_SRF]